MSLRVQLQKKKKKTLESKLRTEFKYFFPLTGITVYLSITDESLLMNKGSVNRNFYDFL